jgi:hypothetical protein
MELPMATIQGIYVAIFGRPADPAGLAYWNAETNNGADLSKMIGALSATDEFKALYDGKTNEEIVTAVYQSLFGRAPDAAGLEFYLKGLEDGTLNIASIAVSIVDGAQDGDKAIVDNKVAAADLFTASLDTQAEIDAYVGTDAADAGRAFLAPVTGDPETIPTQESVDETILTVANPDGGQAPGETPGGGGGGGGGGGDTTAPVFTSPDAITIKENLSEVSTVNATDATAVTYSIGGGADAVKFAIDTTTGDLKFVNAPDYENPSDADDDNVYELLLQATDTSGNTVTQNVTVTVENVNEFIVGAGETYTTINAAIQAASAGDQIIVKSGTYDENVNLDKAVSIIADPNNPGATIAPATGTAITVQAGLSGSALVSGIDLRGNGVTNDNQRGIDILPGADLGSFIFEKGTVSDFGQAGIWASDGFAEIGATPTVDSLIIRDATFTNNGLGNGQNPNNGSDAQIKLFGFAGKVEVTDVAIGATLLVSKGIELTGGLTSSGNANTWSANDDAVMPLSNVTFNNVTVTGNYAKNPVSLQNYLNVDGVSITGLDLSGATSAWSLFNIDSIGGGAINGPGFGIVFPTGYVGGSKVVEFQGPQFDQVDTSVTINSINVSGVKDDPEFAFALLRGGSLNDTLNGSDGVEQFWGLQGDDTIIGGGSTLDMAVLISAAGASDFSFTYNAASNTYTVEDTASPYNNGTDTISGVEFIGIYNPNTKVLDVNSIDSLIV